MCPGAAVMCFLRAWLSEEEAGRLASPSLRFLEEVRLMNLTRSIAADKGAVPTCRRIPSRANLGDFSLVLLARRSSSGRHCADWSRQSIYNMQHLGR